MILQAISDGAAKSVYIGMAIAIVALWVIVIWGGK